MLSNFLYHFGKNNFTESLMLRKFCVSLQQKRTKRVSALYIQELIQEQPHPFSGTPLSVNIWEMTRSSKQTLYLVVDHTLKLYISTTWQHGLCLLMMTMNPAKTAQLIEMPLGSCESVFLVWIESWIESAVRFHFESNFRIESAVYTTQAVTLSNELQGEFVTNESDAHNWVLVIHFNSVLKRVKLCRCTII